jgi:SAM-dependent methyltransferase
MTRESENSFQFTGREELENSELMINYNSYIVSLIRAAFVRERGAGQAVVDFGAGIGTLTKIFRSAVGFSPVTIELDGAQRLVLSSLGFQAYSSLTELADEAYGFCYSANVLEHIEDDVEALKKIKCKLKEGGRLALWVPAFPCLWNAHDERIGHKRRYTRASLRSTMERAGFEVHEVRYCDSVGFVITFLFKLIGRRDGKVGHRSLLLFDRMVFPVSRALDGVCGGFIGKNVFAVGTKR